MILVVVRTGLVVGAKVLVILFEGELSAGRTDSDEGKCEEDSDEDFDGIAGDDMEGSGDNCSSEDDDGKGSTGAPGTISPGSSEEIADTAGEDISNSLCDAPGTISPDGSSEAIADDTAEEDIGNSLCTI
jgi:hypothetical protein